MTKNNMEKEDKFLIVLNILASLLFLLFISILISGGIWNSHSQEYTNDKVVPCNDNDGDIIKGVTCYETITCSDVLQFMNFKECERFGK